MAKTRQTNSMEFPVIRGEVLGTTVLRGFARLCDLARISKADIYDQKINPTGTQRDLNPQHARAAYEYVKTRKQAYWPEVFLCLRNQKAVEYVPSKIDSEMGTLRVNVDLVDSSNKIVISRVDGNHRLHYADGAQQGFEPIERIVSFCLAYDLKPEQEITLFRDINDNQRRMNTSHLDNIEARLTPEGRLKREEPDLYISKKLSEDPDSPFYDRVYEGGKKLAGHDLPLRSLKSGIEIMLSRPTKLTSLEDPDAQYKVIKNYFDAIKQWQPEAWETPRKYLLLRGAAFWGVCDIGADVIDRALSRGKFSSEEMLEVLRSGQDWDWSNKGPFQGFSGRGGAKRIRNMVTKHFKDESGVSVQDLYSKIMKEH